ncbi:MAG: pilin [Candidatus Paceibacterota bacterium]|jgi:hypothetical protein
MKKILNKAFTYIPTLVVLLQILVTGTAHAETTQPQTYTLLAPSFTGNAVGASATSLTEYLKTTFNVILGLAGVAAVVQIVRGGLMYMTPDSIGGKTEGKKLWTNAVYGLILAIAAWLILSEINPEILNFKLFP